ncbi:epimerase family protein [Abditibacteriota bacterium]|nr:epimerase family protein [Abditibacteriota bacterium]
MPRLVLTGGSGYLGRALTTFLTRHGWQVTLISRHDPQDEAHFVAWDAQTLGAWVRELDGADAVINLAGRSVNCRYNDDNKRLIRESRIHTTGLVARAISEAKNPPPVWLNASSATFYRHALDRPMDETDGDAGHGFSVDVVEAWENALFAPDLPHTRRVALRLAMAFGPGKGGVYEAFSFLVKVGFGGPMAGGHQFVSWIHVHDFARSCLFLIEHPELSGPVNIAAPNPRTNAQFLSDLRRSLNIPVALPTMRWQLELGALLMGTETELLLKSRRVVPTKLLEAGFQFQFEHWIDAARAIVASAVNKN